MKVLQKAKGTPREDLSFHSFFQFSLCDSVNSRSRGDDGGVQMEVLRRERRPSRKASKLWRHGNERPPLHPLKPNVLQDIFESVGQFVDGLKFAGGSHSLMPKSFIKEVTDVAHKHDIYVSTGDWAENLLRKGPSAFKEYVEECKSLGFDTIELNVGSLGIPEETLLRFVRLIKSGGLKVKPQFAVQINKSDIPIGDRAFGAYVVSRPRSSEFVEDVDLLIRRAERCLEAGADMIMIDADDVCEQADSMRADIIAKIIGRLGVEKTMFEASNPRTSEWFVKQYGPRVNLFVDHSQVMDLECLRGRSLGKNHTSVLGSSYFLF
ncbi:protein HEAT-STRESS-ASSOCIATED 32 [Prunus yedoensis var. nudiflora]|uniref:Protein HEAT-STRESS-ASSOCIATED 32 n=1 Tax=Prunus yedoensis var. nudiflora TaxID=2094558 RepID=A0A314XFT2_PRUYE|nr:protein HEAT-STRESS-ASSOCIATED 32 [Prunus yedoensis var. nudiflora]